MINTERIEGLIKEILICLGENPNREGLIDTPKRVARMYEEVFNGINYSNDQIADMYDVTFNEECNSGEELVLLKNIEAFSFCEHHMALMYNMKISVAYIPNHKVIGLSKIVRICDLVCRRLQLQERIGSDILYILKKIVSTDDIAIKITAEHSCITTRGIKRNNATTTTMTFSGKFKDDPKYKNDFLQNVI